MKKRACVVILAFAILSALFPRYAFAAAEDDISDLFREGDTGDLLTIDDFSFLGHSVLELSISIHEIKELMVGNGIGAGSHLSTFDEDGLIWIGGDIHDSKRNLVGNLSAYQFYDDTHQVAWRFDSVGDEHTLIGIGSIETNDSLEAVLKKFGFTNAALIAQKMNETAYAGYSTSEEAMKVLGGWFYRSENGLHFCEGGSHTAGQAEDGKWHAGWIQIQILYHKDDFGYRGVLTFENDKLISYSGHKWLKAQIPDENTADDDLDLPIKRLTEITDISSAAEAVSDLAGSMTPAQKTSPDCIDLATLYAETAAAKASTQAVSGSDILINAALLSPLEPTAIEASAAVETALNEGGVTTARYLSKTVVLTTEEASVTVRISPDALTTSVDKVRVETPSYALTFKLSDLEPDLTRELTFTAEAANPQARAANRGVSLTLPGGRTTNSITVSLPTDDGASSAQTVATTDGAAASSKYNPATTDMDGRVNQSGTYTIITNEKDFTDISNKSQEMQDAIRYLASRGIINGRTETTFDPDGSITRAEIANLLVRALGKLDAAAEATFSDVTNSNWYYAAAASSQRHGLIKGYDDNTFRGTTEINKVQIVAVSSRVLKTEMGYREPAAPATYLAKYSDSVSGWAQAEVALATRENLVVYRTDGTFSGDKNMTRGDAAIIIYRLFQRIW